jgi:hypothetical protein
MPMNGLDYGIPFWPSQLLHLLIALLLLWRTPEDLAHRVDKLIEYQRKHQDALGKLNDGMRGEQKQRTALLNKIESALGDLLQLRAELGLPPPP